MVRNPARRPGDHLLDKYCPHLTPEEREAAHERLRRFAAVVIRVARRVAEEDMHKADSLKSEQEGRIPSL